MVVYVFNLSINFKSIRWLCMFSIYQFINRFSIYQMVVYVGRTLHDWNLIGEPCETFINCHHHKYHHQDHWHYDHHHHGSIVIMIVMIFRLQADPTLPGPHSSMKEPVTLPFSLFVRFMMMIII